MFNIKNLWFDFWGKKDEYKSNILNSILFRIDKILYKTISTNAATPPVSPVDGEIVRVMAGATGRFQGKEDYLAFYYNNSWRLIAPQEGFNFYDKTVGKFLYYNGSHWVNVSECYADHNKLHNYDEHEHEDWGEPGPYMLDVERIPFRYLNTNNIGIYHDLTLGVVPEEHVDWSEPGEELIDVERIPRDAAVIATREPTGFPLEALQLATLEWTDSTRTFTIQGNYYYFYHSTVYRKNPDLVESVTISDDTGFHFIYYEGAVLTSQFITTHLQLSNILKSKCLVGGVYWNSTTSTAIVVGNERHGIGMSNETHHYLHETRGAQFYDGADISGYTLNDDSDAGVSFDLTNLQFYDEDIPVEIEDGDAANQYEQVLTGDAEIPVLYRDDIDGSWTQSAASTLPYLTAGGGNLAYMNDDGDGTWSQVEVTNNRFVSYTLIATNDWIYPIKMIQGTAEYTSHDLADGAAKEELIDFGDFPSEETCFLYRFTMQTSAAFGGTKNAKIIEIIDIRGTNDKNFRFARLEA